MSSQQYTASSETTSLLNHSGSGDPEWAQNWIKNGSNNQSTGRSIQSPLNGQQSSTLPPPMPQSIPSPRNSHNRSRSAVAFPTQSDPNHPFNRGQQRPPPSGNRPRSRPSSRNSMGPPPVPQIPALHQPPSPRPKLHRRAKSDVPLLFGSEGRQRSGSITKADLLKNFPNPRWGGRAAQALGNSQHSHRQRTSSDGGVLLVSAAEASSISSGGTGGYGSVSSGQPTHPLLNPGMVGSVALTDGAKRSNRHKRAMSDASIHSVTTNMAKSALFRGVTAKGTLQLQLPKDDFRVLMDCQLEAGCVYKRKLVDDEDAEFLDYHTVEEGNVMEGTSCVCTCAHCQRCHDKTNRLPPALYVMAVDSTLYRRMLDEIIHSRTMPCGTYFCGHHEDVRHPDIKIAMIAVSVVFVLLLAGAVIIRD